MNSLNISIPYDYAIKLVKLNWCDLLFAINQRFFSQKTAVLHALDIIVSSEKYDNNISALAYLNDGESIHPYVDNLASMDTREGADSLEKILYVLLSWVYDNKVDCPDRLEVVEYIYADFDYPEDVAKFVRYMPAQEKIFSSYELNIEHLFLNWKKYLDNASKKWE